MQVDRCQVDHCKVKVGNVKAADGEDKSVDSPNGMLIKPEATSKTRRRKERRKKLAAAIDLHDTPSW